MTISIPQIGFDRVVRLDWADKAMQVRAGLATITELGALLDAAKLGVTARKKTQTVLNRLWLEPHPSLLGLADAAVDLRAKFPQTAPVVFCWGMAISAYPFFGQVAENIGRLSALHGDCTTVEIHRRTRERFGERETIYRVTNWVLQTQADWNAIRHGESKNQVLRQSPLALEPNDVAAWLVEAAVRYTGKAMPVASVPSMPVLFPFQAPDQLAYLLTSYPRLEVQDQGFGQQVVDVRTQAQQFRLERQ